MQQKEFYVKNKDLLNELNILKATGVFSDTLHMMFLMMCKKISNKPCWSNYTWTEDMVNSAYIKCIIKARKFNVEKKNPFSYFTSIIINYFKDHIKMEKKQGDIKRRVSENNEMELLLKHGIMPKKLTDEEYNKESEEKNDNCG